ncbi:unnamed protein product [Peniophora sp. CBMAI 1063]|nr:unnamed protein product [Peniophora sp. CBMAI 1063]
MQRALDRYDQGITPSEIYVINQLEAMRLTDLAWKVVTEDTICHCWEKTDILPDMSTPPPTSNPLSELEWSMSDSLDALEECDVLQKNNHIDLEELVNSAAEQIVVEETLEEEICSAVLEWHVEGDVIAIIDDEPETSLPSCTDALAAVATLQQYIWVLMGTLRVV